MREVFANSVRLDGLPGKGQTIYTHTDIYILYIYIYIFRVIFQNARRHTMKLMSELIIRERMRARRSRGMPWSENIKCLMEWLKAFGAKNKKKTPTQPDAVFTCDIAGRV